MSDDFLMILEELRQRLLDLTSRNKLLNFRFPKATSLKFQVDDLESICKKLVDEQSRLRIDGVPQSDMRPLPEVGSYASSIRWRPSGDLPVVMFEDTLMAVSRKIEREANSSISETGTNTLFLILGFLEYQESANSQVSLLAPLVSVPVTIEKKLYHGQQKYYLVSNGEEVEENLSLREKMKRDFNIILPDFDVEKFSLTDYINKVERVLKKQPAFKINRSAALGFLSFKGMLMIKDLDHEIWKVGRNANALLDHPILKKLLGEMKAEEGQTTVLGHSEESYEVDSPENSRLPLVYDADHSQYSALIDVLNKGRDLVVQGPPGTGKSQTITNIIAGALDKGLSVLFVAEKLAALEVVKDRLDRVGLEPMLLELHSDKANKKTVLQSLKRRLSHNFENFPTLDNEVNSLQRSIEELNRYSAMMRGTLQNSLNLTVHSTLWRWIRLRESGLDATVLNSEFSVSDASETTIESLAERIDFLVELNDALNELGSDLSNHPFDGFYPNTPTPILVEALRMVLTDFNSRAKPFKQPLLKYEGYWMGRYGPSIKELPEILQRVESWLNEAKAYGFDTLLDGIAAAKNTEGKVDHLFLLLNDLESSIQEYERLKSSYTRSLIQADEILSTDKSKIENVLIAFTEAGVLVPIEQIKDLNKQIQTVTEEAMSAIESICGILKHYGQDFDGSRSKLRFWLSFGVCLAKAPIDAYGLQSDRLFKPQTESRILELASLKETILELQNELEPKLYFDQLPDANELSVAIRTLRAGTEWYRVFSSEYRAAINLHKATDQRKRSLDAVDRLRELERLASLLEKKKEWVSHPGWDEVIGRASSMDIDLNSYLALAKWNSTVALVNQLSVQQVDQTWLHKVMGLVRDNRIQELNEQLDRLEKRMLDLFTILPNFGSQVASIGIVGVASLYDEVSTKLTALQPFIDKHSHGHGLLSSLAEAVQNLLDARDLQLALSQSTVFAWMVGQYKGIHTDIQRTREALQLVDRLVTSDLPEELMDVILSEHPIKSASELIQTLRKVIQFRELVVEFQEAMSRHGKLRFKNWFRLQVEAKPTEVLSKWVSRGERVLASMDSIYAWSQYWQLRSKADSLNVLMIVKGLEQGKLQGERIADIYKLSVYNSLLSKFLINNPSFSNWTGAKLNQLKQVLKERDKKIIDNRGRAIAKKCSNYQITDYGQNSTRVDELTEAYLINHLIKQERPRVPLRKLMQRAPSTILALKPCFMMSPQSVVRFLAPKSIKFDLLVMDEASQLKPEEAISAIARAKQVVVVGDSKQLPPTSFFQTNMDSQLEDDDAGNIVSDSESILEIASRAFGHSRSLNVHYRSKHQSLVAFSNQHFYENKLLLFPSPFEPNRHFGVRALYMANAIFQDGLNHVEAAKVVDLIVDHVNNRRTESLGVVAVNLKQSDLIAELLDRRVQDDPTIATKMEEMKERLFIKNLENVQGDERDVMIVSTTYGRKPNMTSVQQRFGPIGYENGWRRLNVLFTRARNSMIVVTSMKPSDIKIYDGSNFGIRTLKNYLEYVFNGSILAENTAVHEPESEFEESVIGILTANGYDAVPQLGVAGYRIDIAVKHPHYEGMYLAAIECDGATYHSSKSARERDRIRQEVLENLGWRGKIWRIWSTDWFRRREDEKRKLLQFLADRKMELQEIYEPVQHWEVIGNEQVLSASNRVQNGVEVVTEVLHVTGIDETLLGDDTDEIVVKVGDTFTYSDLEHPDVVKTATIVRGESNEEKNHISYKKPFAEAFIGCAEGEIAELLLKDNKTKRFKLLMIEKKSTK